MRITNNWLREFVTLPTDDPAEIAAALEGLGFEVEEIAPLTAPFEGVVVGRVEEVRPHPNADKLRLCRVDVGDGLHDVVCGAWNFEAGAVVPVALPGSKLGRLEITERTIRGETSHGMICSEQELGLGDDHEGIMVLDEAVTDAAAKVGDDFGELLDYPDTVLDVAVAPNRPDAMSVMGLARELAAHFDVELRVPSIGVEESGDPSVLTIEIEDPEACPRFYVREVRDLTVGPSPLWMRTRLLAGGVRPINNVVDASNYAMLELGHPTHAFDADRLGDRIVVRRAASGETLVTLDGTDRTLVAGDIVVTDGTRPVALAGVMGGADTEVAPDTTRVFVEAAYWHPPSILATSKRLGLRSEASARFERGMDPEFCAAAADRVAELLQTTSKAAAAPGPVDAYPAPPEPEVIRLPMAEIGRVLGESLPVGRASDYLRRLGFGVEGENPLRVTVPTRRPDVSRPVDLVEEIARLEGYDRFADRVATGPGGGLGAEQLALRRLRDVMIGAGYHEAATFSFLGEADLEPLRLAEDDPRARAIAVANPLNDEQGALRTTLLPGLLRALGANAARQLSDVALFEIGKVFLRNDVAADLPDQPDHLAFVATGRRRRHWSSPDGGDSVDVFDATGLWELLAHELRLDDALVRAASRSPFHPGRAAEVVVDGTSIGMVGELHPHTAEAFGLGSRVIAGEIEVAPVVAAHERWEFVTPSTYPPVIFDMAFESDAGVPASHILATITSAAGADLESSHVFDVFSGPPLDEGRRSIAVTLVFRNAERTLSDADLRPVRRAIAAAVETETGAILRGEV